MWRLSDNSAASATSKIEKLNSCETHSHFKLTENTSNTNYAVKNLKMPIIMASDMEQFGAVAQTSAAVAEFTLKILLFIGLATFVLMSKSVN